MAHNNDTARNILEGIPPAAMDMLIKIIDEKVEKLLRRMAKEDSVDTIRKLQGQIIALEDIKSLRENAKKALGDK